MENEIPPLYVSGDSAVVSSSGSWFHSLMVDRKKDSLYALVLQYGILYLYWWPLVAEPNSWRCGEAGIATMACTMRTSLWPWLAVFCLELSTSGMTDRYRKNSFCIYMYVFHLENIKFNLTLKTYTIHGHFSSALSGCSLYCTSA